MEHQFVIRSPELCAALGISKHTLLLHRAGTRECKLLKGLPEPIARRPYLTWLRADIERWLESRSTFSTSQPQALATQPPKRPRGRPRKKGGAA